MASFANHHRRHRSKQHQSCLDLPTVSIAPPVEHQSLSKRTIDNKNSNGPDCGLGAASTLAGAINLHRPLRISFSDDKNLSITPAVRLLLLLFPILIQVVYDGPYTASAADAALGKERTKDTGHVSPTTLPPSTITSVDGNAVSTTQPHKHSSYVISQSDKLHKFDLFIDPICEQIDKLTEKQLDKVHAQMKQFSQIVSLSS